MKIKKYFKLIHSNFNLKFFKRVEDAVFSFSLTEKILFWTFVVIFIGSAFSLAIRVSNTFLVNVPGFGGTIREGIIGTPRFINPLLASSNIDRDLTSLVYSGLMRKTATNSFLPDLADKYEVSEDKLQYTFYLKDNIEFHDGTPITTDDIIFTILKTQDPQTDSSKKTLWEGVSIEKISPTKIIFRLQKPNINFIQNTTMGILPKHLWDVVLDGGFSLSKYNNEPIGSGPYKVSKIKRDSTNIPISYTLEANSKYSLGKPYISKIIFFFAKNTEELIQMFNNGKISSIAGIEPKTVKQIEGSKTRIIALPLPRIFGVFLNQNESPILANSEVREALDIATPKTDIVEKTLSGFASKIKNPIPIQLYKQEADKKEQVSTTQSNIDAGRMILEKAGWTKNENGIFVLETEDENLMLSFSISTSNVPELVAVATQITEAWRKLGADVALKVFEISDLNQTVIRPRNFDALLFGMVVDQYLDLYGFWHSSQRIDPGLNITGYTNITVDKNLEKLKKSTNENDIQEILREFNKNMQEDLPAIFLYSPEFIYIVPKEINGIQIDNITNTEDRFMNINEWFIQKDKVWRIFN